MIRFIYLNGFIALHTIIFCLWFFLILPFDRNGKKIHFYAAKPWAKMILWVCGVKVRASGGESLDPLVPRVYMSNHQSYFDIFALLAYVPVDFKFILKQELMRIPLMGLVMKRAGYIAINRHLPKEAIKSMDKAVERIKAGTSVVVFPEGTRSVDGKLQPFKKGAFILALKAGCDIVPVTISNSYRIVPKGSLEINKGSFCIHIGQPISAKDYTRDNLTPLMDKVKAAMLNRMEEDEDKVTGKT